MGISYHIHTHRRHRRQLIIDLQIATGGLSEITLQLPLWRPGRYERQQYERILGFMEPLDKGVQVRRTTTHTWLVSTANLDTVRLRYICMASRLDAGGSYADTDLIYINPVNCLLYDSARPHLPCTLKLDLPQDFQAVCALPRENNTWTAKSADELFDAPILASDDLQHHVFPVADNQIHLWFYGAHTLDFQKLETAFRAFTEAQIRVFGDMPCKDFHFLYLISEARSYHGVEHPDSTVITLGPAAELLNVPVWNDLLSISSHELFHLWNVKRIRPADMVPYDYTREQYSELHDITEGFTTYYGELMLVRASVWNQEEWLAEMNDILNKHQDAPGKNSVSLRDASFLSWVNGYHTEGLSHQKISFYHKGALVAMLLDLTLRKNSNHAVSLDSLMRRLYQDYTQNEYKGYTREDILNHLSALGFTEAELFYQSYVAGLEDVFSALAAILPDFGLKLEKLPSADFLRSQLGLRLSQNADETWTVTGILPDSPAAETPLNPGDIIQKIDGVESGPDLDAELKLLSARQDMAEIQYITRGKSRICLIPLNTPYEDISYRFIADPLADSHALLMLQRWISGK